MEEYLNGFNDGYKKAMELIGNKQSSITIDGKEIAKYIYKDITKLQEEENTIKNTMRQF